MLHVEVVHVCAVVAFVARSFLEELAGKHFVGSVAALLVLFALAAVAVACIFSLSLRAAIGLSVVVGRIVLGLLLCLVGRVVWLLRRHSEGHGERRKSWRRWGQSHATSGLR
jgi:hypothetical protein